MLKLKYLDKDDWTFTSNSYIVCSNCSFYEKYEIESRYSTLNCNCNKVDLNKWYWIQHNQSNMWGFCLFSKSKDDDYIDWEERSYNKETYEIVRKKHKKKTSIWEIQEGLMNKSNLWLSQNKNLIIRKEKKDYNFFLSRQSRKKKELKEEIKHYFEIVEKNYWKKLENSSHIILWDIHNRVWYVWVIYELAKKYNLEVTFLGDYLDREFWYSEVSDSYLTMKLILDNSKKIKTNLILWNHDWWFLRVFYDLQRKDRKSFDLEYFLLIWTSMSNGWKKTLEDLNINFTQDLHRSEIIWDLYNNIKVLEYSLWLKRKEIETFKEFSNLLLRNWKIIKKITSKDNKTYLTLHHWIPFWKDWMPKVDISELELIQNSKEEKLNYVSWEINSFKQKETWRKMIKIKYRTLFNFLGRRYNSITNLQRKNLLKKLDIDWIIFWHDNKYLNEKESLFWLDNTDEYRTNRWNFNWEDKKILRSIKII